MINTFETNFKPSCNFNIIFNSPHSGSYYNKDFLNSTDLEIYDLRTSEDTFVSELFNSAKTFSSVLMEAKFPRSFVDLNRSHLELDPNIITGNFYFEKTARNMAGLGVIPRFSGNGKEIYTKPITIEDAQKRLEYFYFPYHQFLKYLILESQKRLGYTVLFDCHSMPSKLNMENKNSNKNNNSDIILGDANGTSCSPFITEKVKKIFENYNFFVTKNHPFSGGFITKNYGDPDNNIHVIQIEINKKLYMDEINIQKNVNFESFRKKLILIIEKLSKLTPFIDKENLAAE